MFLISDVKKKYGKKQVLNGAELSVAPGECIGLLGMNGSGKSTLLNILSGVISCDCGSFCFEGRELLKDKKLREALVGFVPQNPPLIEELSAKDNLLLWYSKEALNESLQCGIVKAFGIDGFLKTPVNKMSGGMKKRLSIACAMSRSARLMLMDEPSAALDPVCKEQIKAYIKDYCAAGNSVIISTHDVTELEICSRLLVLKGGKLSQYVYDGDPNSLARALL